MQELTIRVRKVVILTGRGTDKVSIDLNQSSPIANNDYLSIDFDAKPGTGYDYVTEYMGIRPELVEVINIAPVILQFKKPGN